MNNKELSPVDFFSNGLGDYIGELPEFTLDMFLNNGTFKDFPYRSN